MRKRGKIVALIVLILCVIGFLGVVAYKQYVAFNSRNEGKNTNIVEASQQNESKVEGKTVDFENEEYSKVDLQFEKYPEDKKVYEQSGLTREILQELSKYKSVYRIALDTENENSQNTEQFSAKDLELKFSNILPTNVKYVENVGTFDISKLNMNENNVVIYLTSWNDEKIILLGFAGDNLKETKFEFKVAENKAKKYKISNLNVLDSKTHVKILNFGKNLEKGLAVAADEITARANKNMYGVFEAEADKLKKGMKGNFFEIDIEGIAGRRAQVAGNILTKLDDMEELDIEFRNAEIKEGEKLDITTTSLREISFKEEGETNISNAGVIKAGDITKQKALEEISATLYMIENPEKAFKGLPLLRKIEMKYADRRVKMNITEDIFSGSTNIEELKGVFASTDIEKISENAFKDLIKLESTEYLLYNSNFGEIPVNTFRYNRNLMEVKGMFAKARTNVDPIRIYWANKIDLPSTKIENLEDFEHERYDED